MRSADCVSVLCAEFRHAKGGCRPSQTPAGTRSAVARISWRSELLQLRATVSN